MLGRADRTAGYRLGEEFCRYTGRLAEQRIRGAGQPGEQPPVYRLGRTAGSLDRLDHLPGDPLRRRARRREGTAQRITMPGGTHRRGHLVVQRRPDQRMPESEAIAGLRQHADGTRLVHGRDQVRHPAAKHRGQIRDREVHAEQGRGPQHLAHRPGHEVEAVRDGRRQGARRGTARQLGGPCLGDGQAGTAGQRGDELGDVQGVARRPVSEPQQVIAGPAARQGRNQVGHRVLGELGELDPARSAYHSPQRGQVIALRGRAPSCRPAAAAPVAPTWPAAPHKATLAWSAHCRSSTTRTVGRTAHSSATSASTALPARQEHPCRGPRRSHRAAAR